MESTAIPRWEAERRQEVAGFNHPVTVTERDKVAPQMVHVARVLRPTDEGTWYHFVAHKQYEGEHCSPVTNVTGVVVRDAADRLVLKHLSAFAADSCGSGTEPRIIATLHWAGPVLWIARQQYEDGFDYFLYDPVTDVPIELRGAHQPEEPMRAMSIPLFDDAAECGFEEFRRELSEAVSIRNLPAVQKLLTAGIEVTQNERGVDAFNRHWRPEVPDSPLWPALESILNLGGACHRRTEFTAPYIASVWPWSLPGGQPWMPRGQGILAIVARDVPLRLQPRADAALLATLDYAMVRPISGSTPEGDWVAVDAGAGRRGYVEARYLVPRSPFASFLLHEGSWRIAGLYPPEP